MDEKLTYYRYEGPVWKFGTLITNKWVGETKAVSTKKAYTNLIYQFKKMYGLTVDSNIRLTGKITPIGG